MFPVAFIWKLKMPIRRKLALIALMATSLFTMVASILKAIATQDPNTPFRPVDGLLWAGIEQNFVIIMACVPALMPLAKLDHPIAHCLGSFFDSIRSSRKSSGHKSSTSGSSRSGRSGRSGQAQDANGPYQNMEIPDMPSGETKKNLGHEEEYFQSATSLPGFCANTEKLFVSGNFCLWSDANGSISVMLICAHAETSAWSFVLSYIPINFASLILSVFPAVKLINLWLLNLASIGFYSIDDYSLVVLVAMTNLERIRFELTAFYSGTKVDSIVDTYPI